ncbi:Pentatricopeptide repeat-containing protein [Platanthera zijinensis]|uniref:Pentatricopeptide repeat-containing protein n=1 Tax=Platanthera zijinensis TaxID=2320716 RepID=A0AAP0FXS2_9ASPA
MPSGSSGPSLEEAVSLEESMPMKPNEVLLGSLMATCRFHGDVELAERLMDLLQVKLETDSNYVLLSNIYTAM